MVQGILVGQTGLGLAWSKWQSGLPLCLKKALSANLRLQAVVVGEFCCSGILLI